MDRIEQCGDDDCLVAATAMVRDLDYEDVHSRVETPMALPDTVHILMQEGYDWRAPEGDLMDPRVLRMICGVDGGISSAILLVESPISERDEDAFWDHATDRGDMQPKHAVAYDGNTLLDPKSDPYWDTLTDLALSPYKVTQYLLISEPEDESNG